MIRETGNRFLDKLTRVDDVTPVATFFNRGKLKLEPARHRGPPASVQCSR